MQRNLWNSLETLSVQAALMVEWRQALGNDFSAAQVFLRPTLGQAESYPCIHPVTCGCRHRVLFESEDEVSAVCDCEEAGCEPIFLRPADLLIHALNGEMIAAALRHAFGFGELQNVELAESRSRLVGSWGVRRSHVFFNVPISEKGLLLEVERLSAAFPNPFILLTPTSRFCSPLVQHALRRQGCAQMALAGVVALTGPGQLALLPSAKPIVDATLEDFGKRITEGTPLERAIARVEEKLNAIAKMRQQTEALSENVARQAVEIVQKLDAGDRTKKPSLLTVFRLYCVNGLSAGQIAIRLGCSKAVVMKRLKLLEEKTGTPPSRLRTYSAQFDRVEDEIGDSRARRIDRWEHAHGSSDEDETS